MAVRCLIALAVGVSSAYGLHPRPWFWKEASYARWLVHESDYAVVSTMHNGTDVFGNIMSISDGDGYEDSTGVIYTYLPNLDATYVDLMADDRVSLTFSEMALDGGNTWWCRKATAESPPCGRLVISGRLTRVPPEQEATALKFLFARHPVMKDWDSAHMFQPFYMAPENITDMFMLDMYGGAKHPTVKDYLAAPWHGGVISEQSGPEVHV